MPDTNAHILIVDDEPDIRHILQEILLDEGYHISLAANAKQARARFSEDKPDIVLLDIWMPDEDGISVLKNWVEQSLLSDTPVIMISGHGTVENAVEAVKLGAYDFLEKPLSTAKLLLSIERALERASLTKENTRLKSRLNNEAPIISNSEASQELLRHIRLLGPTDSWVFITGESGTGKHLVAKKIHQNSPRANAAFIELNLAAMPSSSVAQQLFGSEKDDKVLVGAFEQAQGGTLFIHEVLGLELDTQNKLLSALLEQQFIRLGGQEYIELDVRVIVTTSGNPEQAVNDGLFLQDLYYRLNVIPIHVPSLRQRGPDLPELIDVFINDIANRNQIDTPEVSNAALDILVSYRWPGNVRQLQNILQRLLILNTGSTITTDAVNEALGNEMNVETANTLSDDFFAGDMRQAKENFEIAYLKHHIQTVDGNVSELAKKIGLERTHLYRKLKSLNINARDAK